MDLVSDALKVFLRQKTQKCVLATSGSFRLAVVHSHGQGWAIVTTEGHAAEKVARCEILVHLTSGGSVGALNVALAFHGEIGRFEFVAKG